jgi:hypothetical protein
MCEKGIEEFEIPMRVLMDRFHANMEQKNIEDAVQAAGSRLKHRPESQNDCSLPGSGGHVAPRRSRRCPARTDTTAIS